MTKITSITVTTPSLGVQQWRHDGSRGQTRIAWATEGGRGVPRRVIILPVVADRARNGGEARVGRPGGADGSVDGGSHRVLEAAR